MGVIFADKLKFNLFGRNSKIQVERKLYTELKEENVMPKIKHGGGEVMLLEYIEALGVGNLVVREGTMSQYSYIDISKENLQQSADKLGLTQTYVLPGIICFTRVFHPKHIILSTRLWILYI